jgi:hypothetical protein
MPIRRIKMKFDEFTEAYLECALWTSTVYNDEPLDRAYNINDIAPDTLHRMVEDCRQFQTDHSELIADNPTRAGHDFWLTRNGHGSNFLDGDWPESTARTLYDAAKRYREFDLYVGDNGLIHGI